MKQNEMTVKELYSLDKTMAGEWLSQYTYPWEALPHIGDMVEKMGADLPEKEYRCMDGNVWIHHSVQVPPTACIKGPAIICEGTEIRTGAFIRGKVLVGKNCVVGNSVELKNVILFDHVQTPHYNYVGDSILGYKAHMGAGSITSNVKSDKTLVKVHAEDGDVETGLKKMGAMLGDCVEVGCNSVLNPGTVIGSHSNVYPLSSVRGCVGKNSIYKKEGVVVEKKD